jgi:hypothetical protein
MKNLRLLLVGCFVMSMGIIGCSKGSAGSTGPAGPAGPDSVIHSPWISLSMALETDANNDTAYFQTITAPSITEDILDNGLVLSYMENLFVTDGSIVDVSDYAQFLDVTYNLGVITITSFIGDLSGVSFRYVVIPGSIASTGVFKQYTKAQIKAMDYNTVTKLLNAATTKTAAN